MKISEYSGEKKKKKMAYSDQNSPTGEENLGTLNLPLSLTLLPPDTPEYQYEGFEQLLEAVAQSDDHRYIVFSNVLPETEILSKEDVPGRLDFYFPLNKLVLKMPKRPHEVAAEEFGGMVMHLSRSIGFKRSISFSGALRVSGDRRQKEPDRSWGPSYRAGSIYREWPTVVLEVGDSETRGKLEQDIAWWLSNGEVKQAFIIDIKKGSGNIYMSAWAPNPNVHSRPATGRSGRVSYAPSNQQSPQLLQRVKIIPRRNGQPARVEGEKLRMHFESLLLRAPNAGEGDIIFDHEALLEIAEKIWDILGCSL